MGKRVEVPFFGAFCEFGTQSAPNCTQGAEVAIALFQRSFLAGLSISSNTSAAALSTDS